MDPYMSVTVYKWNQTDLLQVCNCKYKWNQMDPYRSVTIGCTWTKDLLL